MDDEPLSLYCTDLGDRDFDWTWLKAVNAMKSERARMTQKTAGRQRRSACSPHPACRCASYPQYAAIEPDEIARLNTSTKLCFRDAKAFGLHTVKYAMVF